MDLSSNIAQQIAHAAIAFEQQRTGHRPESVTVVLSDDTLVIALHGALSPAERMAAQSPESAGQIQEFHRQLFSASAHSLLQQIKQITGIAVREAFAEVEPATGTIVKLVSTGTIVQVMFLADRVPPGAWSGSEPRPL